jgi:hypothetical protein
MGIKKFLGIATTALALTGFAAAQNNQQSTSQLVGADAILIHSLDAKTIKQGDTVTAKLTQTVHIAGGKELPRNTQLIGHVDEVQPSQNNGTSKVVLTFDKAKLANGEQVAIKSTIVGVFPEGTKELLPTLNPELQVEQQPSGPHGYSLTSNVQGDNSGTLSAQGKNVHLGDGTSLQFAIAPGANAASTATGN